MKVNKQRPHLSKSEKIRDGVLAVQSDSKMCREFFLYTADPDSDYGPLTPPTMIPEYHQIQFPKEQTSEMKNCMIQISGERHVRKMHITQVLNLLGGY